MASFGSRSPSTLISFYEGTGNDSRGRCLSEILLWGATRLESSHDYIQTLFPLPEQSGVNERAPIIDREVFHAFRTRSDLRERLRASFEKMLWFYGFELVTDGDGNMEVRKGLNYALHATHWHARFDHNHLRITRIIRSLRVLGLEGEALAFYRTISRANSVSTTSRVYWARAAYRPLNVAPNMDEAYVNEEIGPKFLLEYEKELKEGALSSAQPDVKNAE